MRRTLYALFTALLILTLFLPAIVAPSARAQEVTPAFSKDPDLEAGYRDLYERQFVEARSTFTKWISKHPDEAFGHVSLAASYLFEELFVQGVLTSDYFCDDKRFVGGISGAPDPERIKNFNVEIAQARTLAQQRIKKNSKDPEG